MRTLQQCDFLYFLAKWRKSIYVVDSGNRVQLFSCNGDYLFMDSEGMSGIHEEAQEEDLYDMFGSRSGEEPPS